ncbi:hypothetical protein WCE37_03435 [Luteimonas sp. MJ250]|uniref:hypothetical protein n=1 Tax=Luteimonas sp. MJ250 TaxID=3129236 RepID=UPI0031BB7559
MTRQRLPSPDKAPRGAADKLRKWAAEAVPQKVMARRFGVGVATLKRWMEEDERLEAAYDEGVEEEHQMLYQALKRKLATDNGAAAMFLLKTRHGYREGDQTGQANRVQVTFTLPGAATKEQWTQGRVIEPDKRALEHDA